MLVPARLPYTLPVKLHPLAGAVQRINTRNFFRLAGVNQYFSIPATVVSGYFSINFLVMIPAGVTQCKLLDGYSSESRLDVNYVGGQVVSGDYLHVEVDGVASNLLPSDGHIHSVSLIRDSSDSDQSSRSIGTIGARYDNTTNMTGIIASLRITGDNITSGGEPVNELFYPLDDSPEDFPVIRNAAVELGPEMWSYSVASDGSSAQYDNIGGVFGDGVETNTRYLVKIKMTGVTNGSCRLRLGNAVGALIGADGEYNHVLDSGEYTRLYLQDVYGGFTAESVEISVKKAPGYGQFINGSVDAYGEFTERSGGNWLGSDLSIPPWDSESQLIEVAE